MTDTTATKATATGKSGKSGKGEVKHLSYGMLIARRFFRQPAAVAGLVLFILLLLFALFGNVFGKWSYDDPDFLALSQPPSAEHWLGTDPGGSDIYALVVHGLGKSMLIGIITSVSIMVIASILGTAIAFFGGWVERIGMWCLDCLLVIPQFLLVAMIVRMANAKAGWVWLIIGLTAFGWVGYARIIRTMTLSLRERDYVKAARFMGVGSFRIMLRHLVPNLASMIIINTVLGVVGAVNSETALSFLNVGIKPPDVSLGSILQIGANTTQTAPWIVLAPAVALILFTFSMQLIGDGLRDAFDPNSAAAGKVGA